MHTAHGQMLSVVVGSCIRIWAFACCAFPVHQSPGIRLLMEGVDTVHGQFVKTHSELQSGCYRFLGSSPAMEIFANHNMTEAALRIVLEVRFLYGCATVRAQLEMFREILSHDII